MQTRQKFTAGLFGKNENPMIGSAGGLFSGEDLKDFRLMRGILDRAKAVEFHQRPGITRESEVSDWIVTNRMGGVPLHEGALYVPMELPIRQTYARGMAPTVLGNVTGYGAEMIFTEPQEFIQVLRNAMRVRQLGARVISNLVGPISFPRQTEPGTLYWTGESPAADVTDSAIGLDAVNLSPKSAQSSTGYTRQLLAQSSLDVEMIIREDLASINAIGIDLACIAGSGTANQPRGILNTDGVTLVEIGANGGVPTYGNMVDLSTALERSNVPITTPGYLMTPQLRGVLKQTPIAPNYPLMVIQKPAGGSAEEAAGYPATYSNQMPSGLTKGTSNDCHSIIFGNWSDLIIGEWGVLEMIVDPYRLKKQGIIEVTTFVMIDVGLRHPESFSKCLDARLSA